MIALFAPAGFWQAGAMFDYLRKIAAVSCAFLAVSTAASQPVHAEEPMTAAEFETYVNGKTLYFGTGGTAYGVEKYLGDRRVRWSFLDGNCRDGIWFEQADNQICFLYEHSDQTHCWQFYREGQGLRAVFENDPDSVTLYEVTDSNEPMMCHGPDLGV